jgi:hypothetical protein
VGRQADNPAKFHINSQGKPIFLASNALVNATTATNKININRSRSTSCTSEILPFESNSIQSMIEANIEPLKYTREGKSAVPENFEID